MADSDSEKVPGRVANADEKLHGVVNASGFAFQLGIEHQIRETAERHQWKILSREHAWRDGSRAGFADLILEKGILRLVIECKRVREGVWIFLVPEGEDDIGTFRAHWADSSPDKPNMVGWHPMNLQPPSPEAEFCVVRGQGEGDKPMLERIASSLLDSISAIAIEELDLPESRKFAKQLIHIPVIVTNADLVVCRYSASKVDVRTGMLSDGSFTPISVVRFRKSLAFDLTAGAWPRDLTEAGKDKERSILVSTAASFPKLLETLWVHMNHYEWPGIRMRVAEGVQEA